MAYAFNNIVYNILVNRESYNMWIINFYGSLILINIKYPIAKMIFDIINFLPFKIFQ